MINYLITKSCGYFGMGTNPVSLRTCCLEILVYLFGKVNFKFIIVYVHVISLKNLIVFLLGNLCVLVISLSL